MLTTNHTRVMIINPRLNFSFRWKINNLCFILFYPLPLCILRLNSFIYLQVIFVSRITSFLERNTRTLSSTYQIIYKFSLIKECLLYLFFYLHIFIEYISIIINVNYRKVPFLPFCVRKFY